VFDPYGVVAAGVPGNPVELYPGVFDSYGVLVNVAAGVPGYPLELYPGVFDSCVGLGAAGVPAVLYVLGFPGYTGPVGVFT